MAKITYLAHHELKNRYDFLRSMCNDYEGPVGKEILFAQAGEDSTVINKQLSALERRGLVKHVRISPDENNLQSRTAYYPLDIDREYPQDKHDEGPAVRIDPQDLQKFQLAVARYAIENVPSLEDDLEISSQGLTAAFKMTSILNHTKPYFIELIQSDLASGHLDKLNNGYLIDSHNADIKIALAQMIGKFLRQLFSEDATQFKSTLKRYLTKNESETISVHFYPYQIEMFNWASGYDVEKLVQAIFDKSYYQYQADVKPWLKDKRSLPEHIFSEHTMSGIFDEWSEIKLPLTTVNFVRTIISRLLESGLSFEMIGDIDPLSLARLEQVEITVNDQGMSDQEFIDYLVEITGDDAAEMNYIRELIEVISHDSNSITIKLPQISKAILLGQIYKK